MDRSRQRNQDECARVRSDLGAAIDGELAPPEIAAIEAHLRECLRCRALDRELRQDWESLLALPASPARDGEAFLAAVRARLRRRRARTIWRLAAALGSAAAVVLAALLLPREPGSGEAEFLHSLPILVDLREETRDLDAELIGLLLDRLGEEPAGGEADGGVPIELDPLLEEELEGMRS